ncbi:hypothetical protein PG999_009819 [Apiospora kogelbergensis]|uniref:Uncharacterized protein n=1 Tax=Apiospora kogelbergensis TaxID=1337665 RepID=A0AAW0QKK6_9PEZI
MPATIAHPVYSGTALSLTERLRLGRKYGRYDFGRFDQLTGSSYYLGKGSIGEMEVACNFLFTKSRWGVLSEARNPGGIVYLDLVFTEPPDCRLKGASVKLTLDEDDEDLRRHFAAGKPPPRPRVPVHITEHGPQKLRGEDQEAMHATKSSFVPQVNAGSFGGFGGVGRETQQQQVKRSNWRFSSQAVPNRKNRATTLQWDLNENELDRQPSHSNRFHTGFAFEHDGQPFFMQVEVSGHLESTTSDLKHKVRRRFKRFKFPAEPQSATTLVNFGGRNNAYKDPLDQERDSLQWRMVEANMSTVPLVSGMQHGNKRLYQASAEMEEVTMEEETEDVSVGQIEQPYTTNLLTATETAQLRADAMSVLSLGQSSTTTILQSAETRQAAAQSSRSDMPEARDDHNAESVQTRTDDSSETLTANDCDSTATEQDDGTKPPVDSAQLQRLLQEANLPPLLQLIILWLMSLGMKRPQLEKEATK